MVACRDLKEVYSAKIEGQISNDSGYPGTWLE